MKTSIRNYIGIARCDHWVKNIFVFPGVISASPLLGIPFSAFIPELFFGFLSVCLISSSNYVINEWLDAGYDKFHPLKKNRPSVVGALKRKFVYLEYLLLMTAGLGLALAVSKSFFIMSVFFLFMGILYNVKPIRTKDIPVVDVLSESINNPVRLILGWFIVSSELLPPASLLLSYWMGGAFFMSLKRFGEYRYISSTETAAAYRKSFRCYNEQRLLIIAFFFAMACALNLGVFLVKYKTDLILTFPFVALLFAWYFYLALKENSSVQYPERLYKERGFMIYCALFTIQFVVFMMCDVHFLDWLLNDEFLINPLQ